MTKNKKMIILISSVLLVALVVGIILIVNHLNDDEITGGDKICYTLPPPHLSGKILEIIDDKTIIVENIYDETDFYAAEEPIQFLTKGEKVKIIFDELFVTEGHSHNQDEDDYIITDKYEMMVGDMVDAHIDYNDLEIINGEKVFNFEKMT